jgi:glycosyltransferase EpsD
MKKKAMLFAATTCSHIYHFMLPFMKMMSAKGYDVDVIATKDHTYKKLMEHSYIKKLYLVDISRNPFNIKNIQSYKEIKTILINNNYNIVHTNTPIMSFYLRLAARKLIKTKVVYMAHGFHFFKGSPLRNWLLYFPAEYLASRFTDDLITINNEDYCIASKWFKTCKIHYISGTGIDLSKYKKTVENKNKTNVIICVSEFIERKNHKQIILALSHIIKEIKDVKVWFVGCGKLVEQCKDLANHLEVQDYIKWLGFRYNIPDLLNKADLAVLTSYHEGVPRFLLEAMACSKPIVATNVRGNRELVMHEQNGYLVNTDDHIALADACIKVLTSNNIEQMGEKSFSICRKYDIKIVKKMMLEVYSQS